jgi:signal transduction histidine kinase/ActR/RegA family two-component response regulator
VRAAAQDSYRDRLRAVMSAGILVAAVFALQTWLIAHFVAEALVQASAGLVLVGVVIALGRDRVSPVWAGRIGAGVLFTASVAVCLVRGAFLPTLLMWNALIPVGLATSERRPPWELWVWSTLIVSATALVWWVMPANPPQSALAGTNPILSLLTFFPVMFGIASLYLRDRKRLCAEKEEIERQRRVGAKMESVGRLAGGVAHDFNNLLAIISTYGELLAEDAKEHEWTDALQPLEAIAGATERGRQLTRQLLAYGGRGVRAPVAMYPEDTIRGAVRLLERTLPETLSLRWHADPDGWAVCADPSEIEHATINLVLNARDAMPQGGDIDVSCANVVVGRARKPGDPDVTPGRYVCIEVRDRGVGMSTQVMDQIFDPFFTTKDKSKGSGLGLTSAYNAARQLGGDMTVSSQLGRGSRFRMYLPVSDESADVLRRARTRTPAPDVTLTILLVEDEEQVRVATGLMLRSRGFQLVAAASGEEAVALFERHRAEIDAVLTDILMPGMSGVDVARAVRAIDPDVGIVFMSGYAEDPAVEQFIEESGSRFIRKPFGAEDVTSALHAVARVPAHQRGGVA